MALREAQQSVLIVDTNRVAIAQARLEGIATFSGSIVGPHTEERLDLSGLGRMLAITSNDEVNSLACVRFAKVFGRSQVYQLAPTRRDADSRLGRRGAEMAEHLRGRQLFCAGCTLADLEKRLFAGAAVKRTLLTEVFNWASFRMSNPDALPMFVLGVTGELTVIAEDLLQEPRPGETVVSLTTSARLVPATTAPASTEVETVAATGA